MTNKAALNPENRGRKRGRPTREEEVRRTLAELGVDPGLVDPRRILAAIAGDSSAPAGARVAACRALMAVCDGGRAEDAARSDVAERAIRLMAAARRAH